MSVVDLPPGIGLVGTPLGTFRAPPRARRLAAFSLVLVIAIGALTWALVLRNRYYWHASTHLVLAVAFAMFVSVGFVVRSAKLAVTRDGVRWGWESFGFTQEAAKIVTAHVYQDGVALQAKRGSQWFLAARDWERFEALVRQLRRAELPIKEHAGKAPLRMRLQSYGRFLDAMLWGSVLGAAIVMLWAA